MNKKELSKLRDLNREIKEIREDIERVKHEIQSITQTITDMPRGTSERNKTEELAIYLADYKNMLEIKTRHYWQEKERLEEFISSIDDCRIRLIIRLRYMNGLSLREISWELGSHDESYSRKTHDRFLAKINKK